GAGMKPLLRGREPGRAGRSLLVLQVADRELEELVERDLGPVSRDAADLGEIRHAPAHVLEGVAIDLLVGHELNRRFAVAMVLDALRQLEHCDFLRCADVEDLAHRLLVVRQPPYTSLLENRITLVRLTFAASSTTSVPRMFVMRERSGSSST